MSKFKALNLLNNKGFWPEKAAILDAVKEVLTIGRCRRQLPVRDYGRYREPEKWRDEDGKLVPYHSVDWYVYDALDEERIQVDAERILQAFAEEPWRGENALGDHYDLFIMEEDMFDPSACEDQAGVDYAVGRAARGTAAVISTHRIDHIWGIPYSYLKTEVMRQLCFMFGVPDMAREDAEVVGQAVCCTNRCILRAARLAPDEWDILTEERIREGALCTGCEGDLRRFFEEMAAEPD